MERPANTGWILKASIFATGCAGIVAEYVLSTLATYLTGNAVFQFTIVMSLMLFSMGLGSRYSKAFRKDLLDWLILIEFLLSLLCASSAVTAYGLLSYTTSISLVIYLLACIIGVLIGFEIPLVTRMNDEYEELRTNIANIMEKDYYGALIGGVLFAFVALPYLGLTYTPIVLGSINFLVASLLFFRFRKLVRHKKSASAGFAFSLVFLILLVFLANPIIMYGEQKQYKDKVIFSRQTPYQKIIMTQWRDYYWLYINGQEQFSTFDEEKYHEPLVHPAMGLAASRRNILILGGGDGLALREILKYPDVERISMVDLDKVMTDIAKEHPVLVEINKASMRSPRLTVYNMDAASFFREDMDFYDVVIIDLPDPDTVDLMHLYAKSFYQLVLRHLRPGGVVVTQASSPYFSPKAFLCINKTMEEAGLSVVPYHNQIPTMGQWGWVLGVRRSEADSQTVLNKLLQLDFTNIKTKFINKDAMNSMFHFGKGVFYPNWREDIKVNTQANPVLHTYYHKGNWAMY